MNNVFNIDFTKMKFPSYDQIMSVQNDNIIKKFKLFDFGIFGYGYISVKRPYGEYCICTLNITIPNIMSKNNMVVNNTAIYGIVDSSISYEIFKRDAIKRCDKNFSVNLDCSSEWED